MIFVVWLCVNSVGHGIIVYCMYGYEFSVFLVYLLVDVLRLLWFAFCRVVLFWLGFTIILLYFGVWCIGLFCLDLDCGFDSGFVLCCIM